MRFLFPAVVELGGQSHEPLESMASLELARGITGFRHHNEPELPATDTQVFKGHCYSAARSLGGQVRLTEVSASPCNFARVVLEIGGRPIAILLNAHYPIIGFVEPQTLQGEPLRFIDALSLAITFQEFGAYDLWSASQLDAPLCCVSVHALAEAELSQIRYWQPGRIGDVIFNCWD